MKKNKASSFHTERKKTKRQGKELAILSLLAEQKEEGEANSNARKNAGYSLTINFCSMGGRKIEYFHNFSPYKACVYD
jgi:hypothetical protein